jgi:transcriptional regulator with XRE-family HTH domain
MAALGRIVRNQRAHSALRIDDASDLVGVTHTVLSKIENGQSVGLDKLFKVLNGLGLKMIVVTPTEAEDAVRALHSPPGESD